MLTVGIHEDVILKNVEITEKEGKISVDFSLISANADEGSDDPLAEKYDENGMLITGTGGTTTIKVWPVNVPDTEDAKGVTKTTQVRIQEALNGTAELQNLFTSFAQCYLKKTDIKFERFRGLQLTKDNLQNLLQEEVLIAVTRNLATQFIEMCAPHFGVNDEHHRLRVLLRRQSKAKHFPTFRDKLLQAFPTVELMSVPKEASRLAFTRYEIQKGLNSGTPAVEVDETAEEAAAPLDTAAMFGASAPDLSADASLNQQ